MRENIKSVGLILAIAIASVSLPIGIMGFNKDATINNYYTNNYYTTNNNTTIINNNTTIINNNNTYIPETTPKDFPLIQETMIFYECNDSYSFSYIFNITSLGYRLDFAILRNETRNTIEHTFILYDKELYDLGFTSLSINPIYYEGRWLYYQNSWVIPYCSIWVFNMTYKATMEDMDDYNSWLQHKILTRWVN